MSKRKLSEKEISEALKKSDKDFSNDDSFDWIPQISDSGMLFEDDINTKDEAEEDSRSQLD